MTLEYVDVVLTDEEVAALGAVTDHYTVVDRPDGHHTRVIYGWDQQQEGWESSWQYFADLASRCRCGKIITGETVGVEL